MVILIVVGGGRLGRAGGKPHVAPPSISLQRFDWWETWKAGQLYIVYGLWTILLRSSHNDKILEITSNIFAVCYLPSSAGRTSLECQPRATLQINTLNVLRRIILLREFLNPASHLAQLPGTLTELCGVALLIRNAFTAQVHMARHHFPSRASSHQPWG